MANKTQIPINCEYCLFYNDLIHPTENFTCKANGILLYNLPCENFCINTDDISLVNTENPEYYSYIRSIPTNKLSILASLLVQEGYNRAEGWSIGDVAYYNLGKTDAISSWVQVIFKGLAGNTGMGIVEGVKDPTTNLWFGKIELKYLYKEKEWREIHKRLLAEGKIKDDAMETLIPGYNYPLEAEMVSPNYKPSNIIEAIKKMKE